MKTTFIPALGKGISHVGLGCVTFGREIDDLSSFEIMDYAFDKGVTLFDTAAAYSSGVSEKIVGQWLSKNHGEIENIIIATKILPPFEKANIVLNVEQSLTRLQQESIDILFLHSWHQSVEDVAVLEVLGDLVGCGKIKAIGVSNFNTEQLKSILLKQLKYNLTPISFIQNNNNVAVSDIDYSLLQLCENFSVHIITYSPLAAGFLTGKYLNEVQPDVRFEIIPGHKNIYFKESAWKRLETLLDLAKAKEKSSVELALAWALGFPNITSVLVGCRSIDHLNQALNAVSVNTDEIFRVLPIAQEAS